MTAEESFEKFFNSFPRYGTRLATDWKEEIIKIAENYAIEFAKFHVEAALKAASEQADMIGETQHNNNAPDVTSNFVYVVDSNGPDYGYIVNKESILNAYPLENIK